MKRKQLDCNKCNIIFVKLNTFNKHMKRQDFLVLCSNRIIFLEHCTEGANMKIDLIAKKYNFIFVKFNIFNAHMKRQHHFGLGRHRITLLGQLYLEKAKHMKKSI